MTALVVLTVIVIVLLIAGLAVYLYWAGTLLDRIGGKLEGAADIVRGIVADAELIGPGVEHINQTGGVVAGALPLLYGMAEQIVAGVTPAEPRPEVPEPARPASGTRRSRLLSGVGYRPELPVRLAAADPAGACDRRVDVPAGRARPSGDAIDDPRHGGLDPFCWLRDVPACPYWSASPGVAALTTLRSAGAESVGLTGECS